MANRGTAFIKLRNHFADLLLVSRSDAIMRAAQSIDIFG
jgi:hypothetical protein